MADILRILSTSRDALLANLTAINVTGSNVANVNTPGYSRVRPIFGSISQSGIGIDRSSVGVNIQEIQRIYDKYLEAQIVQQQQEIGYHDMRKSMLDRVESSLNESDGGGINELLSKFWNAWNDLAANPSGSTERDVLLKTSESLAYRFRQQGDDLLDIQQDANTTIADLITETNADLVEFASLNDKIVTIEIDGGNANSLRDTRAQLLKEIGTTLDIQYYETSDGAVNIYLANGNALVQGDIYWQLDAVENVDNSSYYDIVITTSPGEVLNGVITGGKIGALLELRDATLVGYINQLNDLAINVANKVNSQHRLGYDMYNNAGGLFFSEITDARDMQVAAAIAADSQKIAAASTVNGDGGNALAMGTLKDERMYMSLSAITATDFDAGGDNPAARAVLNNRAEAYKATTSNIVLTRGAAPGDWTVTGNGGYAGLAVLSADATTIVLDLDNSGTADITITLTGTWEQDDTLSFSMSADETSSTQSDYFSNLLSRVGQDVLSAGQNADRQEDVMTQLENQRESVSGVSIDEEMMQLMKYQFAYSAAGQLVTTVKEMLDLLIELGR
ncbi:MAG: flagellar hook-associated protein FlgK [Syntrophales bacterium]|nr:flagellar hook-associated protein FlgK [Syntrophales bacterium]MDD5231846.1 flagellar hook-associated protein FlgK [Syntrophales bacterium]MDD5531350.1 flagellar hook-associated protein FlgK [Syntrophales bacterium]HPL62866.1 flagellar hook-associated protein FlgK [Syntrophales bacterium]